MRSTKYCRGYSVSIGGGLCFIVELTLNLGMLGSRSDSVVRGLLLRLAPISVCLLSSGLFQDFVRPLLLSVSNPRKHLAHCAACRYDARIHMPTDRISAV
ncbi:unnamed protein product [Ectocarpus sp. 4 AP-2014]